MQIIFEAIRGISIRSDIAIDDISFQRGPCKGKLNLIEFALVFDSQLLIASVSF